MIAQKENALAGSAQQMDNTYRVIGATYIAVNLIINIIKQDVGNASFCTILLAMTFLSR